MGVCIQWAKLYEYIVVMLIKCASHSELNYFRMVYIYHVCCCGNLAAVVGVVGSCHMDDRYQVHGHVINCQMEPKILDGMT